MPYAQADLEVMVVDKIVPFSWFVIDVSSFMPAWSISMNHMETPDGMLGPCQEKGQELPFS